MNDLQFSKLKRGLFSKPQANEVEDSHEPNAQLSQVSENWNSEEQEYYSIEYGTTKTKTLSE